LSSSPFLPPDPRVAEPYRLTSQLAVRIALLGIVAVVLFTVLFLRLWALQVISGNEYVQSARDNQIRTVRLQPPRGPIVDRNGVSLVTNVPGTVAQLWPAEVPEGRLEDVVTRLSVLLEVPKKEIRAGIRARENDPLTPVIVKTNVRDYKADYLYEHRTEFPGVRVASTQLRRYEDGSLASHVLGYVGDISEEELERLGEGYAGGDRVGKAGIEAAYDRFLRGEAGLGQVRTNAQGDVTSGLQPSRLPKAGYAVRLTIDADLQRAAEDALRFGIALARDNGAWAANGGAIVAMDPTNGEILALASYPTYDPKVFTSREPDRLEALYQDETTPLVNRALDGLYPAGSAFKPVTALAALEEGVITPDTIFQCEPEREIAGQKFVNWDPYRNEPMRLQTALAASCDTYFYDIAQIFYDQDDRTPLQDFASRVGFGKRTQIDIGPEAKGLVPDPRWRRRTFTTEIDKLWKPGNSVQLAIGQGDLLVTPLQLTRFYALLANGGSLVYPHVVMDVEQPAPAGSTEDPVVLRSFAPKPPSDLGIDEAAIQAVNAGLWDATHLPGYGTSYQVFSGYDVPIAGKTGTAEKFVQFPDFGRMMDQSWWCGWGPYGSESWNGKPPLVVCALVENGGHGGEVAAPVALKLFEEHFDVPAPPITIASPSD
jgi:penicillin-binding protein 2